MSGIIRVARGANHSSRNWRTEEFPSALEFADKYFSGHVVGAKDGACITQGALRAGDRRANQVIANSILMFDHDNGESLEEIRRNIEETGLCAILATTHSHMKPTSKVTQVAVVSHRRKNRMDDASDIDVIKAYLRDVKKWVEPMVESITSAELEHLDEGQTYVVHHDPMPRTRSVFLLEEAFRFVGDEYVQKDRITEWKDRYKGFAETVLRVGTDPTCIDPSRLMYTPRCSADMLEHARIEVIEGREVTMDDFVRYSEIAGVKVGRTKERGPKIFKTRGLRSFLMGDAGKTFRAAEFMLDYAGEPKIVREGKAHYECPWDELHSNAGDERDQGFFVTSAEGDRGWAMHCMHDGCQTETGCDRALWLDKACENFGIEDANELLKYTDSDALSEADMDAIYEPVLDMDLLINSLRPDTSEKILQNLLWQIDRECGSINRERYLGKIKEKTGISIPTLKETLKDMKGAVAPPSSVEAALPNDDEIPEPPAEGEPPTLVMFNDWEYHDKRRCLVDAIELQVAKKGMLYRNTDHRVIRIRDTEYGARLTELEKTEEWAEAIQDLGIRFLNSKFKTMQPPAQLTKMCMVRTWNFPIIEATADIPIFGPDGTIMTEPGYHAGPRLWLDTKEDFLPIPDVITDADVEQAVTILAYTLQDFPFSDCFTGNDSEPVRTEDGEPNWERGQSSRAHAIAMMLQPFCRPLIHGPTPLYFIDKPVKGTGAGYLCNVLGSMLHDMPLPASVVPEREEEFEKRVTSYLLAGDPTIFLDNLNHELSSAALAGALTTGVWIGRRLGQSEQVRLPVKSTWILTANKGSLSDELMRRVAPIRLDAGLANPDIDRPEDFYAIKDFPGYLKTERKSLIWAAHVLVKNYIDKRELEPDRKRTILQSFQNWSRVMGDILHYAGIPGFLDNIRVYSETRKGEESDAKICIAETLIDRLGEREGLKAFEVAEALSSGSGLAAGTGALDIKYGIFLRDPDDMDEKVRKVGAALKKINGTPLQLPDGRQVLIYGCGRGEWGIRLVKERVIIPMRKS